MKNSLHIDLIRKYILQKPGRPFEEVRMYASVIGATEEDLKEAIFLVSEQMLDLNPRPAASYKLLEIKERKKRIKNAIKSLKKTFKAYSIVISASTFAVLGIILFQTVPRNSAAFLNSSKPMTAFNALAEVILKAAPVYAHTQPIDVSQVFSVPASKVTLRYTGKPKKTVLGFFPYWMISQQEKVRIESVTSLALFGLDVDGWGNISIRSADGKKNEGWAMWQDKKIDDLIMRARQKNIKLYLTFKSFNNGNIEALVASEKAQKQFIANAIELVKIKSLDGINIDFEYIGNASPKTRSGFTALIFNLSSELKRQIPNAALSVDTYLTSAYLDRDIFDIEKLANSVDLFVVMGYDVNTPKSAPGPIAPMEGAVGIIGNLESYLAHADPKKIVLGVAYYGYDWLIDSSDRSQNRGVPYAQLVYQSRNSKILWDPAAESPYYNYAENGKKRQVYFENTQSLGLKYDYVNNKNLAGVALWAMGYDGNNTELNQLLIDKFNE